MQQFVSNSNKKGTFGTTSENWCKWGTIKVLTFVELGNDNTSMSNIVTQQWDANEDN